MSHAVDINRYVEAVLSGTLDGAPFAAGKLERAAVLRYLDDMEHCADRGLRFDQDAALDAIDFFPCLNHTTGEYAGEPFELRLFQKFIIWNLWGWRRKDGSRRFRYAFLTLGRGNGKSPFAAAIGNLLFIADIPIEPRAKIYCVATKEKQAREAVFEEAKKQIEHSPSLKKRIEVWKKALTIPQQPWNGAVFEPLGSDSETSDGWIPHGIIKDELHAWQEHHRGLYEKIRTSMGKRRQPLSVTITTAGDDNSQIWQEEYDFAVAVVDRDTTVNSDDLFVFIAEVDSDEICAGCQGDGCDACENRGTLELDPLDERLWGQANPMLREPRSPVKIDELRSLANEARIVPAKLNTFRRYYANQQVASFYKLITPQLWARGNGELPDLDGRGCHSAMDWGWRDDLAALWLVFPLEESNQYALKGWAWCPEDAEHDFSKEPWRTFKARGWLTITEGDTTDPDAIYNQFKICLETYEVNTLAVDPNNAREFATRAANEWGVDTVDFWQSCRRYNEPTRAFVQAIQDRRIINGNNGLLAWAINNMAVKSNSDDYIMPSKNKSSGKIDPAVACIMAFGQAIFNETEMDWWTEEAGVAL